MENLPGDDPSQARDRGAATAPISTVTGEAGRSASCISVEHVSVVRSSYCHLRAEEVLPVAAKCASADFESEPELKRSRVDSIALPATSPGSLPDRSGSGPQTPITPIGPVRIKSVQRPSSASDVSRVRQRGPPVASPVGHGAQSHSATAVVEPMMGLQQLQHSTSFGSIPSLNSPSHAMSTPTSVPPRSVSSFPGTPATQPVRHSAETLRQWSDVLVRSMLLHWPKDMEASVHAVMLRVVGALPLNPAAASDRVRCLASAFRDKKNERLRDEVMGDVIEVERLVSMTERELMNPERLAQMQEASDLRARNKDWSELRKAAQTHSDLWQCPRCGGRDSMWDQKQTRSGDEPMTTLIWCNKCGFHWRKRG